MRLYPHPVNFTPVAAIGLFTGAYISDRRVWLVPVMALLLSDAIIGFYQPLIMLFVYLGFAVSVLIGRVFLYKERTFVRISSSAVVSATVFFILSNFGVWFSGLYYPMTGSGLAQCFVLALPFFGNILCADLFYAIFLFGILETLQKWATKEYDPQAV
jgi:hypothetical protein